MFSTLATVSLHAVWALLLLLIICSATARGQELEPDIRKDLVDYAFAVYFGTGIYTASGRAVQIYTIPLSYTFRNLEEHAWGLKLKLPVTVGFYDFKALDILGGSLPENASTISFVPGLDYPLAVRDNWTLTPFTDIGVGRNLSDGKNTYIYGFGVRSLARFDRGDSELRLGNMLLRTGHLGSGTTADDHFSTFETGLDMRRPLAGTVRGRATNYSLYVKNNLYSNLQFLRFHDDPVTVVYQFEIGGTYGINPAPRLWFFHMPRIGLGIRFGDEMLAFRIIFGMPF